MNTNNKKRRLRPQDLVPGKVYRFILRNPVTMKYDGAERIYKKDTGHMGQYDYFSDDVYPFTYLSSLECFFLVDPPRDIGKGQSLLEKTTLKVMGIDRLFLGFLHYTSGFFDFVEVTGEEEN